MSLPLVIRKNIRDSEPKLKEHLEKITKVTGKEWTFEVDWAKLYNAEPNQHTKDNIGHMIQDECMKGIADNLEKLCTNESSKEAFNEASSNSKITFRVNPKLSGGYWNILFENGDLVVEYKSWANTYEISNFNIVAVIPTPGLPLPVRLNIEKSREQLDEALQRIATATGESDWSFETDYEKAIKVIDNKYTNENLGSTYAEIVGLFATLLENKMKEETIKESFNEATTQHKIQIRVNDKAPDYWNLIIQNGEVILEHKKSIANTYLVSSFQLEKYIPSPGGLSLVQRLNVQKNREKVEEHLERLRNATGEEWTFEADYEKSIKDLKEQQYQADNLGDTYAEALGLMVNNIQELVKQGDTIKEAFMEATPQRRITIQLNDKVKDYWIPSFKEGGILLEHKKSIANLYLVSNTDLKPLIPSPGGLSLVTRVNIEKNKEKVDELLQEIAKAAGTEDWTFEPDYEKAAKDLDKYQIDRIGDTYTEALEGLKRNIEEACKKETIKEAFGEATAERKITIRVNDKCPDYWNFKFENGGILLEHKKSIANMYLISSQNMAQALPVPGVLSLLARLNIEDKREKLEENLEKIKKATGEEYTFDDACVEDVYKKLPNVGNNIGVFMYDDVLGGIASLLEKNMQDEMTKEAFNEVATSHQITVRVDPKQSNYWDIKLENGNVVVICRAYANTYEIANFNLEKLL